MHRDIKLGPRIQRLLSPAVLQAELIGMASWMWVVAVEPLIQVNLITCLISASLAGVCIYHSYSVTFRAWRLMGIIYIVVLTLSFLYAVSENPKLGYYLLPLAIIIVVSSALLFISVKDYLLTAVFVWLLILVSWQPSEEDSTYRVIFCVTSVLIGAALNISYLRNLKTVLSLESKFRELAQTDYLTSIPNRRAFMETFAEMIAHNTNGYFIMLDIDSFKLMNDQYGHDVGDRILCSMAACLKKVKGSYSVGRIGGEEFGVLITGHDQLKAIHYSINLLSTIRNSLEPPYRYTSSAGMAKISIESTMTEVLKIADRNMYLAKKNGKDCVYFDGRPIHS
ncbi:MAG: GGDEF domain-containing protein [Pseudomonas sp.]|nr:MAG: GGDEF domain-containing protein [Pseudomonas sp.]